MIAIIESYKSGLLRLENWKNNIIAGIIVGIVALPLAMAFAISSGAEPSHGIYTSIIAGLVTGIFGGTKTQISGPTGAFVVVLASITAKYGISGLQISTMMAGFIMFIMGWFKLGNLIKFIPHSVIVGFTSGIGCIIFISQIKDFFGLNIYIDIDASLYQKLVIIISNIKSCDYKTSIMSFLSLIILIYSPKYIRIIPSPVIALVAITITQYYFNFETIATIGSVFGHIPQELPKFNIPNFDHTNLYLLIEPALIIALLGAIESLLSAASADRISKTNHNPNQELIGQGLANIISPFFGGFASTGAIARTATSIKHGGNSPIASITHSIILILILLIFAPYAVYIPFSVLSAILFVVAFNMSDIPEFIGIIKSNNLHNSFILILTFIITIFINLALAVIVGVIVSQYFKKNNPC